MALKITVDDKYEIIESGSIIVNASTTFSMYVGDNLDTPLIISFEFIYDGKEKGLISEKTGANTLSIKCNNFNIDDSDSWVGNGNLFKVGNINGHDIALKMRTIFVADDIVFFYSWYKKIR